MKPNHIRFNIDHPNAGPAQAFLNSFEELLIPVEVNLTGWKHFDYIEAAYGFNSILSNTSVTIIFCKGYHEANELGMANCQKQISETYRWTQNGSAIYVVAGKDKNVITQLLGLFAGQE